MKTQAPRTYRMDARAAAVGETRERIVDAAMANFLARPYDEVSLRTIAAEAGVAVQTVVNHFGSKDALLLGAARDRFSSEMTELRYSIEPGDIAGAVRVLVEGYEASGDANVRMSHVEERVPAVHEALDYGRAWHREWVARTFPDALAGLRGAARARRLAQLSAATDVLTWKLLRRDHGLSQAQTATAIEELLEALHPPHHGRSAP